MKIKGLRIINLGLGLFFSSSVSAQETTHLNEVVVTASRFPQKLHEIGKVVRIISAETLAESQGRTLLEVLNNVAGITVNGNGNNLGDMKAVYLRGASTGNTLILIDGIPVNDASAPFGEFDISMIPVDRIARVEIVKGGNSTLYGSDAVAGVINIITQKGYGKLNVNILATAGSYDTFKQAVGLNGQVKKTTFAINASNLTSQGFSSALSPKTDNNFDRDGFIQQAYALNLGQQINNKITLHGSFSMSKDQTDLDLGAYVDALNNASFKRSILSRVGADLKMSKGLLTISFSQNDVKRSYDDASNIFDFKSQISHLETGLSYTLLNILSLSSGLSYKYSATEQNAGTLLMANNTIKSVFTSLFFKTKMGLYAEVGGRYNYHDQSGASFTYTINPSYLFLDRYKFFINWSSAYKVPSLYQLFSSPSGNPSLKPESSRTFETGFDLNILPQKDVNLSFAYFKRQIVDVIVYSPLSYVNQNKQEDTGFELEIRAKLHPTLRINGYCGYVTGKLIQADGSSSNNLIRRPKNSYGVNCMFNMSKKSTINVMYKFVGNRSDNYFFNGKGQSVRLDPYYTIDAYFQYKLNHYLTLFTDIKNLFDKDYVEVSGYTTKGINFNSGIKMMFKK